MTQHHNIYRGTTLFRTLQKAIDKCPSLKEEEKVLLIQQTAKRIYELLPVKVEEEDKKRYTATLQIPEVVVDKYNTSTHLRAMLTSSTATATMVVTEVAVSSAASSSSSSSHPQQIITISPSLQLRLVDTV